MNISDVTDYLTFAANLDAPETVAVYDELPLWSAMFGLMLLKHVPLRIGMQVLDVGCGTGFPLLELAQRLGSTGRVCGIDPWETAVNRAKLKARLWNVRNADIVHADAATMPFPDAQFDLVVSNLGLNNFDNPLSAISECARVSAPSAPIVLTTNLQGHMKEFYDVFESTLRELGNESAIAALKLHIEKRATTEKVAMLLEKSGYRLSCVYEDSATLRFADGSAFLRHYFIKLGFLESWKSVVNAGDRERVFARLEMNLNKEARAHGGLGLTIPMACLVGERV
jgi:arsenite methyltransferase